MVEAESFFDKVSRIFWWIYPEDILNLAYYILMFFLVGIAMNIFAYGGIRNYFRGRAVCFLDDDDPETDEDGYTDDDRKKILEVFEAVRENGEEVSNCTPEQIEQFYKEYRQRHGLSD